MAEQTKAPAPAEAPAAEQPKKKSLPVKAVGIVVVALVIEAVAISAAFIFAGRPAAVQAQGAAHDPAAVAEQSVELPLITEKFQSTRTGRTYIYDTEIFILVREKDEAKVKKQLESMQAQISADISLVFRRAEPAYLLEPTLATLIRQIKAGLDQRMGADAEGKSLVQEVLIKKYTQYRADL